jgi:hypothetical protein
MDRTASGAVGGQGPGEGPKDPLEAAAEALYYEGVPFSGVAPTLGEAQEVAEFVVTAYLDALLEDLPEEALDAARDRVLGKDGSHPHGHEYKRHYGPDALAKFAVTAFLRSLRGSEGT